MGATIDPTEATELEIKMMYVRHALQQQQHIRLLASIPAAFLKTTTTAPGGSGGGASISATMPYLPPPSSIVLPSLAQSMYYGSAVSVIGDSSMVALCGGALPP